MIYKEEKFSQLLGVDGRLHGGVTELPEDHPLHEQLEACVKLMPLFAATRGPFAGNVESKVYKEFCRPTNAFDLDLKASFTTAVSDRYQDLELHKLWGNDKDGFLTQHVGRSDATSAKTVKDLWSVVGFCSNKGLFFQLSGRTL